MKIYKKRSIAKLDLREVIKRILIRRVAELGNIDLQYDLAYTHVPASLHDLGERTLIVPIGEPNYSRGH
jgi:hypothetical protein